MVQLMATTGAFVKLKITAKSRGSSSAEDVEGDTAMLERKLANNFYKNVTANHGSQHKRRPKY